MDYHLKAFKALLRTLIVFNGILSIKSVLEPNLGEYEALRTVKCNFEYHKGK